MVLDDGEAGSADELLRNADVAMYQAKARGRGYHAVFEPAMHRVQLERLELEGELGVAIERSEFSLRYQPVVSLADGSLAGLEALLRWHHPERGVISPLDFVPLAEETGQIVPIGAWVLREACRQMARWRRDAILPTTSRMSVNLSTRQLLDDAFLLEVEGALADSGLPADRLVLEITESVMLVDESTGVGDAEGPPTTRRPHRPRRLRDGLFVARLSQDGCRPTGSRSTGRSSTGSTASARSRRSSRPPSRSPTRSTSR